MGNSSGNTNKIKIVLKAIDVAFSMYSKIPMPRFEWASEDMKYHLCFFPFVGMVIGLLELGWFKLCVYFSFGDIFRVMLALAIPILVTGGFHLDGYMDTMDAIHSYQPKEKKLEILKDPHIGAFSVICLALLFLTAIGFTSEIKSIKVIKLLAFSFVISRALSGLSLMFFKNAKNTGMVSTSTKTADKKIVKLVLFCELILCLIIIFIIDYKLAILETLSFIFTFIYYYKMSDKNFGGITGDLAGFYVCISELFCLIFVSLGGLFLS